MLIKEYLKKYKQLHSSKKDHLEFISKQIEKNIGQKIPIKSISFLKGVVYIKTNPYIKNLVLMNKQKIIEDLNQNQTKNTKDII